MNQNLTFIKYLTIILISMAVGYAWAAGAYLPQIRELKTTIQQLDHEITALSSTQYFNM